MWLSRGIRLCWRDAFTARRCGPQRRFVGDTWYPGHGGSREGSEEEDGPEQSPQIPPVREVPLIADLSHIAPGGTEFGIVLAQSITESGAGGDTQFAENPV